MTRILALVLLLTACTDDKREREQRISALREQIDTQRAPYMQTLDTFLDATSKQDFARAYDMLAPSYTNMVTREQFVAGMATNKNFAKKVAIDVDRTTHYSGTMTIMGAFGDLGRAEISFADTQAGPRISAIKLGGMDALPAAK